MLNLSGHERKASNRFRNKFLVLLNVGSIPPPSKKKKKKKVKYYCE